MNEPNGKIKTKYLSKLDETQGDMRPVSVKVPADLYNDFSAERARAKSKGYDLNITEIVRAALAEAIKETRATLDKLPDNKPAKQSAEKQVTEQVSKQAKRNAQETAHDKGQQHPVGNQKQAE